MKTFSSLKTIQDNKNETLFATFQRDLFTFQDNEDNTGVSVLGKMGILLDSPYNNMSLNFGVSCHCI